MKKRLINLLLCVLLACACLYTLAGTAAKGVMIRMGPVPPAGVSVREITVRFIDVGHGECTFIQAGDETMLIDTGMPKRARNLIATLRQWGVKELDKVLITHPHVDHIGGLAEIIGAFPVKEIIMTAAAGTDPEYANALNTIREKGLRVIHPQSGARFYLANAACTIVAPNSDTYTDLNNTSIVTRLQFGETSFLFTGDASAVSEGEMLANRERLPLKSTLLKCGHHGGISSTSQAFLDAVQPQFAVISCAKSEEGQFPCPEVLGRLKAAGIQVYRTDESGTVTVVSDGQTLKIQ